MTPDLDISDCLTWEEGLPRPRWDELKVRVDAGRSAVAALRIIRRQVGVVAGRASEGDDGRLAGGVERGETRKFGQECAAAPFGEAKEASAALFRQPGQQHEVFRLRNAILRDQRVTQYP